MGLDNSDTVTKPRGEGEGEVFASAFLWLLGLLEGISGIIVQNDKAGRGFFSLENSSMLALYCGRVPYRFFFRIVVFRYSDS